MNNDSSCHQDRLKSGHIGAISTWRYGPKLELVCIGVVLSTLPIGGAYAIGEELVSADAALQVASDQVEPSASKSVQSATIETTPAPKNDKDIYQRIVGIFSEIEGLDGVQVKVNQGVVTLGGEVPNEKKAQQAINLTNRLSDVVTVDDQISRTLDVQDNITPVLKGLKNQAQGLLRALPLLLVAIIVFGVVTWFGSWLARRKRLWERLTPNPFVAELFGQTIKVVFIILGLILGLSLIGAEAIIGTLLGGAGVVGIAVGFAVKDTIENYISSLMLSVRQPFRARDHVVINDHEGIVVRLTSRATILMTLDGNQLRLPNSEVFKGTILNYTKNPERRFTFELGVDANDDPIAAIKVGLDAVNELDFVLTKPKAIAIITQVGDSNIVLEFRIWVNQAKTDFYKARSIAIRAAKHALENKGFSLPEPIYRLRFNTDVEEAITGRVLVSEPKLKDEGAGASTLSAEPLADIDDKHKLEAKARAKKILQGAEAEEVLDATPDTKLMEKVEQEIQDNSGDDDLLNSNSPQE